MILSAFMALFHAGVHGNIIWRGQNQELLSEGPTIGCCNWDLSCQQHEEAAVCSLPGNCSRNIGIQKHLIHFAVCQ